MRMPSYFGMTFMKKVLFGTGVVIFLMLAGRFIYYNIIMPWPYRHELKACLSKANEKNIKQEIKAARNICFRTYPHFN